MKRYGLIGFPLAHSFSPRYFSEKFKKESISASYELFPLTTLDNFPSLASGGLDGLNVTAPYKIAIIKYMDRLDPVASASGAVNTIKLRDGKLIGYNTDVIGFKNSLKNHPAYEVLVKKALILGSGGAARAVNLGLSQLGISSQTVSRSKERAELTYEDLTGDIIQSVGLIINTTPLGMHADVLAAPALPYETLTGSQLCYDLVYNPPMTTFLKLAKSNKALVMNGYDMLVLQAEASWQIWNQDY